MRLENGVFQQNPFGSYGCQDLYTMENLGGVNFGHAHEHKNCDNTNWKHSNFCHPPPLVTQTNYSSLDAIRTEITDHGMFAGAYPAPAPAAAPPAGARRKRRRIKTTKNKEEVESQRMIHIAVERNRRKQMNDYLAAIRSMMPPYYAQRGDQASIVGGAINYVKELEQHLQHLEAQKQVIKHQQSKITDIRDSPIFTNFFTFPQYSTRPMSFKSSLSDEQMAEKPSTAADIEVTLVESHANIKILAKRQPKQLFNMVSWFQSIRLMILHLTITTVDHRVLYSFNLKVEDDCPLTTVNEIATSLHEMLIMIQEEATIFC